MDLLVCRYTLARLLSVRGPYYLGVGSISGSLSLSAWLFFVTWGPKQRRVTRRIRSSFSIHLGLSQGNILQLQRPGRRYTGERPRSRSRHRGDGLRRRGGGDRAGRYSRLRSRLGGRKRCGERERGGSGRRRSSSSRRHGRRRSGEALRRRAGDARRRSRRKWTKAQASLARQPPGAL